MKAQLTICFYVALLPSIIYGYSLLEMYAVDVIKIAKEGGRIEDIFQPTGNETLGLTFNSFLFQGIFLPQKKEIAMKFTYSSRNYVKREYKMYSYLNAVGGVDVEQYGIPLVYYYGTWRENQLDMLGISLLDRSLDQLSESNKLLANDVNILIILRDFILSSKYMHSLGVRHDDIDPKTIMVRKRRSFLIDFESCSKMNDTSTAGLMKYQPRRESVRYPIDDWEMFLYTMCGSLGVHLDWFGIGRPHIVSRRKANTNATMDKIKTIGSETLRNILVQFAGHIFGKNDDTEGGSSSSASMSRTIPDYDHYYKLVNDEIEKSDLAKPVMFTWLTDPERMEATAKIQENSIPDITKITDPKTIDFSGMKYPKVEPKKFTKKYKNWKPSSSSSA